MFTAPVIAERDTRGGQCTANWDIELPEQPKRVPLAVQGAGPEIEVHAAFRTGRCPTTELLALLQQGNGSAGPGEFRRGNKPRQPPANDHGVGLLDFFHLMIFHVFESPYARGSWGSLIAR